MEELTREEKLARAKKNLANKKAMARSGNFDNVSQKGQEQKIKVPELKEKVKTKEDLINDMRSIVVAKRNSATPIVDSRIKEKKVKTEREIKGGVFSSLRKKKEVTITTLEKDRQTIIIIQSAEEVTGAKLTDKEANAFYDELYNINCNPTNIAPATVKMRATDNVIQRMFDLLYDRAKEQGKLADIVDKKEQEKERTA